MPVIRYIDIGMKKIFIIPIIILLAVGCNLPAQTGNQNPVAENSSTTPAPTSTSSGVLKPKKPDALSQIVLPISQAKDRITKKFFGTYVTPQNSPVQPERFKGYHTGLDFETFANEQNSEVAVNVICSGKILRKGYASGYGGYAVQACVINGQTATVVYGHLREPSITGKLGQKLTAGDSLAVLGTGYSSETDGERKHLHLGIHKGASVNIIGYVQNQNELSGWMDPQKVLGL